MDSGFVHENHAPAKSAPAPVAIGLGQRHSLVPASKKESVDTVHTWALGLGRTSAGLSRIGYVFGGVAGSRGLESNSSPTLGTFSQLRGPFWASECGTNGIFSVSAPGRSTCLRLSPYSVGDLVLLALGLSWR